MAGTDFSHLTNDELIKGIRASNLPDYIRSKTYGIDVRETLAQMTEMTIQLGVNMGLSPDDALSWARKLQESVSQSEFDSWVATLLDGGPSIFMNTLGELQAKYPNGAAGVALVRETDPAKIYVWNGTVWEDFGAYQGIEVADNSITSDKLSRDSVINRHLSESAVSISNVDFIETQGEPITSELIPDWSVNDHGNLHLFSGVKTTSFYAEVPTNTHVKINALGNNNRFKVTSYINKQDLSVPSTGDKQLSGGTSIVDDDSKSEFTFWSGDNAHVYIYLNNDPSGVGVSIETIEKIESNLPVEFNSQDISTRSVSIDKLSNFKGVWAERNSVRLIFTRVLDYGSGEINLGAGPSITYRIEVTPDETIRLKRNRGEGNRFRVVVMNHVISESELPLSIPPENVLNLDNGLSEFEYTNTADINKYLYVYLSENQDSGDTLDVERLESILPTVPLENFSTVTEKPTFSLKTSAISDTTLNSLYEEKETYPSLFGVKMTNYRTKEKQYNTHPTPIGWLYHTYETPSRILYADGKPDNLEYLFTWKSELAFEGRSPEWYSPFITKNGDIIFVFRGEQLGVSYTGNDGRQNPIVYPAGDYENPVLVDLGNGIKPTAWLQNAGADYIYNQDSFVFAEYTRVHHDTCNVWKVSEPVTNPNNWRVVKTFELSGHEQIGFKHAHTVNFDPWSERIYLTTGDDDSAAAIYESSDYGETWNMVLGETSDAEKYCRLINFIFTENNVYWATDSGLPNKHFLFEIDRDANGVPDFTNIKELFKFPNYDSWQATYVSAYIEDPNGLLFLNRTDLGHNEPLDVYFWSFETSSMHVIASIDKSREGVPHGFRSQATNWYQSPSDGRIVCGFDFYKNNNFLLGNPYGYNRNMICNLALEVVRV